MKKSLFFLLSIGTCMAVFAQENYKKQPALAVSFVLNDFKTAADLRAGSLVNIIRDKQWKKAKRMTPSLGISYIEGLGDHVDFAGSLSGSFLDYPIPNKITNGNDGFLLEGAATANLKLVTDKYICSPFLTLGVGASKYNSTFGAFIPAGLGLQFNLFDEAFILLNSQYRIPVTENVAHHLYHSIGIAGSLKKKVVKEAAKVELPATN
jgi:hypothetical protein